MICGKTKKKKKIIKKKIHIIATEYILYALISGVKITCKITFTSHEINFVI
jgi:hypothetical protein